jgi:uncharacterized oligopeptide transporter (OPT) family protein
LGDVIRSSYREPVTPEGLRNIEQGTLERFDDNMFSNFNTGVLEQYLEERNRTESFELSRFDLKKVLLMIVVVGLPFTLITQFVVFQTGIMIGGAFYLIYIIGLALKWDPIDININSGAVQAAEKTITGFVFTFPAIFILAKQYSRFTNRSFLTEGDGFWGFLPLLVVVVITSIVASYLGLTFFTIFRKIWMVEDPLPTPAFQGFLNLLKLVREERKSASSNFKKKLRPFFISLSSISGYILFRSFPVFKDGEGSRTVPVLQQIMVSLDIDNWYLGGVIISPLKISRYTQITFPLSGLFFAIGWFLRSKAAVIFLLGSILSTFVIIPMAVLMNVPVDFGGRVGLGVIEYDWFEMLEIENLSIAILAKSQIVTPIAIGAIIGSGLIILFKNAPIFKRALTGINLSRLDIEDSEVNDHYEWPKRYIPMAAAATVVTFLICFILILRFDPVISILFSLIIVVIVFFLGLISVKTTGETGMIPTSTLSLLLFTILMVIIQIYNRITGRGMVDDNQLLLALLTTTVFTCTIAMSSDLIWDFKTGHYIGTRPFHLFKGQTIGMIMGVPFAALSSILLVEVIFGGTTGIPVFAPQAETLAYWANAFVDPDNVRWNLLFLGIFIGILAESITGLGMAFSLGLYLPLYAPLGIFFGGAARDLWEKKWLKNHSRRYGWNERKTTLKTLDSYLVMIGILVGEALLGSLIGILAMVIG